jgi:predicted phosphodiesterase
MRIGVLSDAHGNRAGFEAALAAMGSVDHLVFAGDFLGYYFEPAAVIATLRARGATCILGNHDVFFLAHRGRWSAGGVTVPTPQAYRARYGPALDDADLSASDIDWLASLSPMRELVFEGKRVVLAHGSPFRPIDEYVYPDYPQFERFRELGDTVVIMGHTHRPIVRREGATLLVNPGSCGQPRDDDPRAAFAVLTIDDSGASCEIERAPYDRAPLLAECRARAPENTLLTNLLTRGDR